MNLFTKKKIVLIFGALLIITKFCTANELSLNGIVPTTGTANGYGWTAGISVSGFLLGNDIDIYSGYWEPPISQNENAPYIATNALIFPKNNSIIFATQKTNIIWFVDKITDNIDGTNLTISKIDLHYADTTNFILEITNNIQNTLGEIEWDVPSENFDGNTNYVLKVEVVDSSSLTNSRIFWENRFTIVPEIGTVFSILFLVFCILWLRRHLFCI